MPQGLVLGPAEQPGGDTRGWGLSQALATILESSAPRPLGFPSSVRDEISTLLLHNPMQLGFPPELLTCPMSGCPLVVLRNKPRLKASSKGQ